MEPDQNQNISPISPSISVEPVSVSQELPQPQESRWIRSGWWRDGLLFILLALGTLPLFFRYTNGDLWLDEADYALASQSGFGDNRNDAFHLKNQHDGLIRLRHFHAPLTVYAIRIGTLQNTGDRAIRAPFVLAGGLTIGVVYLCGLALFGKREIALGCSLLLAMMPPFVRMASHAVPWAYIMLEIVMLLGCLICYGKSGKPAWLVGAGGAAGLQFVTSETFFVVAAALMVAVPILIRARLRIASEQDNVATEAQTDSAVPGSPPAREIAARAAWRGVLGGTGAALLVALILWPAGLLGDSVVMLHHYIKLRHVKAFPVNIGDAIFMPAPKWAYLYWYWHDYRPFFLFWVLGALAICLLLWKRKLPQGTVALVVFTVFLLTSAHQSHIIGPEYLAYCLPLLCLLSGYFVLALSLIHRAAGVAVLLAAGIALAFWKPGHILPGMEARTQISRWPAAAGAIARIWKPRNRLLLGPQSSNAALWYLRQSAGLQVQEWQVGQMPIHVLSDAFLANLARGKYRFVVMSSQFSDDTDLDPRGQAILRTWRVVWRSEEKGSGPPRLTVYQWIRPSPVPAAIPSLPGPAGKRSMPRSSLPSRIDKTKQRDQ